MNRKLRYVFSLAVTLVSFQLTASAQDAADAAKEETPAAAVSEDAAGPLEESDGIVEEEATVATIFVAPEPDYDKGDIAWMLVSIALVLMMTCPGLALFYGGLVRKKNILSVMMQCVFLMGLMSVVWAVIGYSLAFGGENPYFGNFDHLLLKGVSPADGVGTAESLASKQIFVAFQCMFFIITPALICGAFAERMKFSSMAVFCVLWGLLIYCPIAHWVWCDYGWLCEWNENAPYKAIDFAGGLVVHISSGVSALICAIVLGKRKGFPTQPMPPHNLTYTCIGTGLLWVGWFGFNGGSELGADGRAVNAVFATHLAAAAGVLGWSLMEWLKQGKASILGACSGAVAGLVCITPASGSVTPVSGIIMGFIAGVFCYVCCTKMKNSLGYDDSLDAFGVHGVGGTLGALLTGLFATQLVTGATEPAGFFDGNKGQIMVQLVSVVAAVGFSAVGTFILLKIIDPIMGLRVSEEEEIQGLDISQHGEEGYIFQ
ncbi:MAG: ammonium transporter [Fuerstiella sp.]|nr:ammonium transporter [Fuerstiella sp.]MCP4505742.1 ammonium transporter [Fuerstiella sp.]MCP4856782.1 ammonium transporter [Fuerstiella sp.]MDG2127589.1 ammonium transporter [Fuerstiella sp.]